MVAMDTREEGEGEEMLSMKGQFAHVGAWAYHP